MFDNEGKNPKQIWNKNKRILEINGILHTNIV